MVCHAGAQLTGHARFGAWRTHACIQHAHVACRPRVCACFEHARDSCCPLLNIDCVLTACNVRRVAPKCSDARAQSMRHGQNVYMAVRPSGQ
eukprot:7448491-Alexandrium_andersonii.AAC.1